MPDWIKPFHDPNDQEYHYFSIENITQNVRITRSIYDAGFLLINSGNAKVSKSDFAYDNFFKAKSWLAGYLSP